MESNISASINTPKNKMAKTKVVTTVAMFLLPCTAKSSVSRPKPTINEPIMGIMIQVERTLTYFLKRISASNSIVIAIPVKRINFY